MRWNIRLGKIFWVVFLLALPVTSFPFFPSSFMGSALVRPLALYPLMILMGLVTIPKLITRPIPRTVIPFFVFIILAVTSTAFSLARGIYPSFAVSVESRIISSLATLAIGAMFYLTATLVPETKADLQFSLRWLYIGFSITLLWATAQSFYVIKFIFTNPKI